MSPVITVKTFWERWKITILFLAVLGLAVFTHEVDVKHNADVCSAVSQVRNAVEPFTTPSKLHGGEDAGTIARVKAANAAKAKAKKLLDVSLACQ